MKSQELAYEVAGVRYLGYFAANENQVGPRPGVLVAPEGGGLTDLTKTVARRLAEAGYAALAMDYYGAGLPLDDINQVMSRITPWMQDPTGIRAIASAALNVLSERPETDPARIGAIGYCFGGTTVLELARSGAPLLATVGFHSGLNTAKPQDAKQIKGKVLVCIGDRDPFVPREQRTAFEEEMNEGEVDWRMNLYGGAGHSFTNPGVGALGRPGFEYHEPTDRRSWIAMMDLFAEVF